MIVPIKMEFILRFRMNFIDFFNDMMSFWPQIFSLFIENYL